jgi:hypothetical protein
LLVAVQEQPASEVTLIDPVPPAQVKESLIGLMAYVQGFPICVMVRVLPAIVRLPVREDVVPFAATD